MKYNDRYDYLFGEIIELKKERDKLEEENKRLKEKETVRPPVIRLHKEFPSLGKNLFCSSCGVMFFDWDRLPTNYCGNCGQKLREDKRSE